MIKQYNPGHLIPFIYEALDYEQAVKQLPNLTIYYEVKTTSSSPMPLHFTGKAMGDIIFINGIARVKTLYEKRLLLMRGCIDVTPEWMKVLLKNRVLKKILVIRNAAFGDLQMVTRALQILKDKHPDAQIHFYGREDSRDIALYTNYCDGIIDVRTTEIGQIAKYYDEVFDLVHTIECNPTADYKDALDVLEDYLFVDIDNPPSNIYNVMPQEREKAIQYLKELGITDSRKLIVFQYEGTAIARGLTPVTTFLVAQEFANRGYTVLLWSHKDSLMKEYVLVKCTETNRFAAFPRTELKYEDKKLFLPNMVGKKTEHVVVDLHPNIKHDLIHPSGKTMVYESRRTKFAMLSFAKHIIAVDSFIGHLADALSIPSTMIFTNYHPHTRVKYYELTDVVSVDFDRELPCGPCNGLLNECPMYKNSPPGCSLLLSAKAIINAVSERLEGKIKLHREKVIPAIPEDYEKHTHACKVCKSTDTHLLTVKGKVPFHRCNSCNSIFANALPATYDNRFLKTPYYAKERNISNPQDFIKGILGALECTNPYLKIADIVRLRDEERTKEKIFKDTQLEEVLLSEDPDAIKSKDYFGYLMINVFNEFTTPEDGFDYLSKLMNGGQRCCIIMPSANHYDFTNTWYPILQPIAGINQVIYSNEGLRSFVKSDGRFNLVGYDEIAPAVYIVTLEKKNEAI